MVKNYASFIILDTKSSRRECCMPLMLLGQFLNMTHSIWRQYIDDLDNGISRFIKRMTDATDSSILVTFFKCLNVEYRWTDHLMGKSKHWTMDIISHMESCNIMCILQPCCRRIKTILMFVINTVLKFYYFIYTNTNFYM